MRKSDKVKDLVKKCIVSISIEEEIEILTDIDPILCFLFKSLYQQQCPMENVREKFVI